uniref:Polypyrimidine tract-binding protein homolog 2 isoform X4 n=1 Tax=Rhizophora mucronata TaxID=61149 RepID=A0A2P2LWD1_RHIMU
MEKLCLGKFVVSLETTQTKISCCFCFQFIAKILRRKKKKLLITLMGKNIDMLPNINQSKYIVCMPKPSARGFVDNDLYDYSNYD